MPEYITQTVKEYTKSIDKVYLAGYKDGSEKAKLYSTDIMLGEVALSDEMPPDNEIIDETLSEKEIIIFKIAFNCLLMQANGEVSIRDIVQTITHNLSVLKKEGLL